MTVSLREDTLWKRSILLFYTCLSYKRQFKLNPPTVLPPHASVQFTAPINIHSAVASANTILHYERYANFELKPQLWNKWGIRNSSPQVFAAGVQCVTSDFEDKQRRMLKIFQRFIKHCSCHIQGECVLGAQPIKKLTEGGVLREAQDDCPCFLNYSCARNAQLELQNSA
jgi:hypothetical protein